MAHGQQQMDAVGFAFARQRHEPVQHRLHIVLVAAEGLFELGEVVDRDHDAGQGVGTMEGIILIDVADTGVAEDRLAFVNDVVKLPQQLLHAFLVALFVGVDDRAHMGQIGQHTQVAAAEIQQIDVRVVGRVGGCKADGQRAHKSRLAPTGTAEHHRMPPREIDDQWRLPCGMRVVHQADHRPHGVARPVQLFNPAFTVVQPP